MSNCKNILEKNEKNKKETIDLNMFYWSLYSNLKYYSPVNYTQEQFNLLTLEEKQRITSACNFLKISHGASFFKYE